ncbi:transcriptional regulator, ArsR family [Ferroglobus placidus DSM 10642]|uniref:Transcriptional regulator, ArsR family n=1 Tax=Ferroglobus placidus (strain DSM 10642 / AEDII12DO) TaxID=589924 RepID=D3RYH1_FERPA|nr:winged helix-turn-helix domain-containing protein [Ferroglobus placidus]ADC65534.1 transcriptional regulator, ArsR family [Ferroglobus placidus DSM 10642]
MLALEKCEPLKIVSRKGVYEILQAMKYEGKKFSELMFITKLNPGILDRHLKALMKSKLVEKDGGIYRLTEKGKKAVELLEQLVKALN